MKAWWYSKTSSKPKAGELKTWRAAQLGYSLLTFDF
jgi:hypothetical protein